MTRSARILIVSIVMLGCCQGWADSTAQTDTTDQAEIKMELLCRPTEGKAEAAQKINVLKIFDGRLYIGHGCRATNTGPTDILAYDLKTGEITVEGTVDDEAIETFRVIDGMLVIPGVDATEDWSAGNCYTLEDGTWLKHRTIPNSVHVWDIIGYHGRWYVGTHAGFDMELCSEKEMQGMPSQGFIFSSGDKGRSWRFEYCPPMDVNTISFTRSLAVLNDKLYAFPDAATFGNTKEFAATAKKGFSPLNDPFSSMDTVVFDGHLWQAKNLIDEPGLRRIWAFPLGDKLGLEVNFEGRVDMYIFDGETAKKTDLTCREILAVTVKPDKAYMLVRQPGQTYLVETSDLVNRTEYLLPESLGKPRSLEVNEGVAYIGTPTGEIWTFKLPRY